MSSFGCKGKLLGRRLIIALVLAWIVGIGMPAKVHAEEVEKNGIEYKVSQTGVTPSGGPIQWSKDGDVVTVKLTGNLLGMITINEGGSYILDANNYAIYPKGQNNAVDGNFMLGADVTLTLKGNGKYYPGKDNLIYLFSGNTKILHIESGVFWNNDISASKIYADKVGNDNVWMMSLKGETLAEKEFQEYSDGVVAISVWGYDKLMIKQGAINDSDKEFIKNMPDPESLTYSPNPTPGSEQENPDSSDGDNSEDNSDSSSTPGSGKDSSSNQSSSSSDGDKNYAQESVSVVITEGQKYVENILKQLSVIAKDGKLVINTENWYCFNRTLTEKIAGRKDVEVTIQYQYQGKKYEVTIPAGTDITSLLDENGFVGFRYLDAVFGGREISK